MKKRKEKKRCAPDILAVNVPSDASQAIRGGRYFIYRPPRTQIPSTQESSAGYHRAAARRLTPPAPPRPPALHLELPKPSSNVRRVLLHDRLTLTVLVLSSVLLANARMPAWLRPSALTPTRLEAIEAPISHPARFVVLL